MPKRMKDSGFYDHPFVQKLPKDGKLLYDYLSFNSHVESSGLYKITLSSMAFETGIDIQALPDLLTLLVPNVAWYPDDNIIWVKEFLSRQYRSRTFLVRVANCLGDLGSHNGIISDYINYNRKYHGFDIPYTAKKLPKLPTETASETKDEVLGDMIKLYESEFGQVLTPTIFDQIKDIRDNFDESDFRSAVKEAKANKARIPVKYILAILDSKKSSPVSDSAGMGEL